MSLRDLVSVRVQVDDLLAPGAVRKMSLRRRGVAILDDVLAELGQLSALDESVFVKHAPKLSLGYLLNGHGRLISHVAPR